MLAMEHELYANGYRRILGIDEVGRGALAGPVVCAGVILNLNDVPEGIQDSKKLSAGKREELDIAIRSRAAAYCIVFTDARTIDTLNILNATLYTMQKVIEGVTPPPDYILADAVTIPNCVIAQQGIIKGDAKSASIAAASIIAKVARDAYMREQAKLFPAYQWERNMGYGVQAHLDAIAEHGTSPLHRMSFYPMSENTAQRSFF